MIKRLLRLDWLEEGPELGAFVFDRTAHEQAKPTAFGSVIEFISKCFAISQDIGVGNTLILLEVSAINVTLIPEETLILFTTVDYSAVFIRLSFEPGSSYLNQLHFAFNDFEVFVEQ